jgi:UDP-glucose 4-epimerase
VKCVVTGVAGFIGSSVALALLQRGYSVVGIDCFTPYYDRKIKESNLSILKGDFTFVGEDILKTDIKKLLDGATWVFHQAAQAGVRSSWGDDFSIYTSNNILATQRLLEGSKSVRSIKKFVYASSSSIYGDAESFPTPESATPKPISPYGVSKLAGEHLAELYRSEFDVPTVSLRYFTVFGPRQRPDMAFHKFIRAGLTNSLISIYGDGSQERDFTYIDDAVEANIRAAERGLGVYNVGGGTHATVNQVLEILRELIGDLKVERISRQAGDVKKTSADTSKIKGELEFSPSWTLKEGLAEEIEWLKTII